MSSMILSNKQREFILYIMYVSEFKYERYISKETLQKILDENEYTDENKKDLVKLRSELIKYDPKYEFVPIGSRVNVINAGNGYYYWDNKYEEYKIKRTCSFKDFQYYNKRIEFALTDVFVHDTEDYGLVGVIRDRNNIKSGILINMKEVTKK